MIEVGKPAPAFTLPDADGNKVALTSLRGKPVLLYFYPADGTPGCTTQACDVRDQWSRFEQAGVVVVGISPDGAETHRDFAAEHDLPQVLLSDGNHKVMTKYEAYGEKVLYGKKTVGVIRSSVLVDADGKVVKHWRRVGAKKHAEQVLKAIDDLL